MTDTTKTKAVLEQLEKVESENWGRCLVCSGTGTVHRDRWSVVLGTTVPDDYPCNHCEGGVRQYPKGNRQ